MDHSARMRFALIPIRISSKSMMLIVRRPIISIHHKFAISYISYSQIYLYFEMLFITAQIQS